MEHFIENFIRNLVILAMQQEFALRCLELALRGGKHENG